MVYASAFTGSTDSEILENAIAHLEEDRTLLIAPRKGQDGRPQPCWLLDRAILLPQDITVILRNCTLKLSDSCRDNFFRSANCGMGKGDPVKIHNIHIHGEGLCTLQGADHPRSSGDSSKTLACPCPYTVEDLCRLADWIPPERRTPQTMDFWDRHDHSYGTDVGRPDQSPCGDWRNIGILLANVEHFSIRGLHIVQAHGWGISLEACAYGRVENVTFDACMSKEIDGMLHNMENQDGVDLRNGCHHITVTDIGGHTGDDIVALTAIADDTRQPGGTVGHTHVMHSDWSRRERDIHDIVLRNIVGYSQLCFSVRLLACNAHIRNVVIDGVIDTDLRGGQHDGTVLIGEGDTAYGTNLRDGICGICLSNVISNGRQAVSIRGYLRDSVITNVIDRFSAGPAVYIERPDGVVNVKMENLGNL